MALQPSVRGIGIIVDTQAMTSGGLTSITMRRMERRNGNAYMNIVGQISEWRHARGFLDYDGWEEFESLAIRLAAAQGPVVSDGEPQLISKRWSAGTDPDWSWLIGWERANHMWEEG